MLLCISFCKHKTVVGSKNCFSVKVPGSPRRWNGTEGTSKVSWAHLQSQAGFCSVLPSPRCQTRIRAIQPSGLGSSRGLCVGADHAPPHSSSLGASGGPPGDAEGCSGPEARWAQTCSQLRSPPVAGARHPVALLRIPGTPL